MAQKRSGWMQIKRMLSDERAAVASRIQALLCAYPNFTTLPCEYRGAT
jgi:hypothetical protein